MKEIIVDRRVCPGSNEKQAMASRSPKIIHADVLGLWVANIDNKVNDNRCHRFRNLIACVHNNFIVKYPELLKA